MLGKTDFLPLKQYDAEEQLLKKKLEKIRTMKEGSN